MTKTDAKPATWTKPELTRLGKLTDVAGSPGNGPQLVSPKAS